MRSPLPPLFIAIALLTASSAVHSYEALQCPTELLYWDKEKAYNGYTLFTPKHFLHTYLMTSDGQIVNSWVSQYEPSQSVYLLPNGHLLHCCMTKNPGFIGGGEGGRLEEYDWEGNLVLEYWCSDDQKLIANDKQLPVSRRLAT